MKNVLGCFAVVLGLGMLFCGCSGSFSAPAAAGTTVAVNDDQYIPFRQIPANAVYSGSTTVGDKFELNLGEDPANGIQWSVGNYTISQCLVRLEHDQEGFWPFICRRAEVEILPKKRGISSLTLQCQGKTVTILVNAL